MMSPEAFSDTTLGTGGPNNCTTMLITRASAKGGEVERGSPRLQREADTACLIIIGSLEMSSYQQ